MMDVCWSSAFMGFGVGTAVGTWSMVFLAWFVRRVMNEQDD